MRSKNKAMIHSGHFPLLPKNQSYSFDVFISYADADWKTMEKIYRHIDNSSENKIPVTMAFNEKDGIPGNYRIDLNTAPLLNRAPIPQNSC